MINYTTCQKCDAMLNAALQDSKGRTHPGYCQSFLKLQTLDVLVEQQARFGKRRSSLRIEPMGKGRYDITGFDAAFNEGTGPSVNRKYLSVLFADNICEGYPNGVTERALLHMVLMRLSERAKTAPELQSTVNRLLWTIQELDCIAIRS